MEDVKAAEINESVGSRYTKPFKNLSHHLRHLVEGKLWLKVILGMIFGVAFGIIIGPNAGIIDAETSKLMAEWLALPGTIFIRVVQMIVIPLILASIIRGIASNKNIEQLKKTGSFVAIYFILTTAVAITIGITLSSIIEPGQYVNKEAVQNSSLGVTTITANETADKFASPSLTEIPNTIGTLLPSNLLGSMTNGEMLQLVIFAVIFGVALVNISQKQAQPLIELLGSIQEACMTIVKWSMWLVPMAVFGLMAKISSQVGVETLIGLGAYVLTVIIGLMILILIYLSLLYLIAKVNPIQFLTKAKDVQLLAFSTSSSAAVMPLSMKTAEEKLGVRPAIAQFIIPIGATINMDGTALYQAVATIFLAQIFGIELTIVGMVLLIITILGASIGSPATPGVGIVILSITLTSIGVPVAGIALIIGVDRILDMCRTTVNVTGDLTAAVLLNKLIPKTQQEILESKQ